jgi:hypothetical protein
MKVLGMQGKVGGQIALEFIIVYSVVLIIFILVFTVIAGQRATILNAQQGSIARIEAQEIAGYIDRAVSIGSGYSANLALAQGPGSIPYNIYVSTSGVVIVNTTYGQQPISAYAFSDGRNMSINGSLQYSGNGISVYLVPTYTGLIKISNVAGEVYIDKSPVSDAGLLGTSVLSSVSEGYAANFNSIGKNSVITVPSDNALELSGSTPSYTIMAWVRRSNPTMPVEVLSKVSSGNGYELAIGLGTCQSNQISVSRFVGAGSGCVGSIPDAAWHEMVAVYNSSGSYAYVDGILAGGGGSGSAIVSSGGVPLLIGNGPSNKYFTGQMSDVQIYNASLTRSQIAASYANGPLGAPVSQTALVGWWPLNGNSNDYSGNGQNGQYSNVTFQTIAALKAGLFARNGTALSNVPVGVVISSGLAGAGGGAHGTAYNGVFAPVVTYNSISPNVTVYSFNDNLSTAGNLIGWWPLTFGEQGNGGTIYDLSPGGDNATGTYLGAATSVQWAQPSSINRFSAAQFPGNVAQQAASNGVITINAAGSLANITSRNNFTLVTWVKYNGGATKGCTGIFGSGGMTTTGIQLNSKSSGSSCGLAYIGGVKIPGNYTTQLSSLNWTMVSMTWSGPADKIYVFENGSVAASNIVTANSITPTSALYYIGAEGSTGAGAFNGLISNVQIYSKTLSALQIAQLYSEGPTGIPLGGAGLSGWWPLTGGTTDYSSVNNGTLSYNSVFTPTSYSFNQSNNSAGRVATFKGTSAVKMAGGPGIQYSGPFSADLWFTTYNSPSGSFDYYLVDSGTPNAYDVQLCGAGACGGFGPGLHGDVGTGSGWLSSTPGVNYAFSFVPGVLYNLVETFSTSGWTMYLNGANVSNGIYSGTPEIGGGTDYVLVGGGSSASSYFFGQISDFRIYNSVLTPGQVEQIYQQGPAPQSSVALTGG